MILAGNRTQVTFSGTIPLDHQDFCRYCQKSSNDQKPDCLHHIYAGAQPEIFQGRGGFLKLGHFDITFPQKIKEKKPPKFWNFLSQILWNYILNGKFNLRMDKIWVFFSKIRAFFYFQRRARGAFPFPPVARLIWKTFTAEWWSSTSNHKAAYLCNCKSTGLTTYDLLSLYNN